MEKKRKVWGKAFEERKEGRGGLSTQVENQNLFFLFFENGDTQISRQLHPLKTSVKKGGKGFEKEKGLGRKGEERKKEEGLGQSCVAGVGWGL